MKEQLDGRKVRKSKTEISSDVYDALMSFEEFDRRGRNGQI